MLILKKKEKNRMFFLAGMMILYRKQRPYELSIYYLIKRLPLIEVVRFRNVDCRLTTLGAEGGQLSAMPITL